MAWTRETDNIGLLAADAARRILWESEHAVPGYRPYSEKPVSEAVTRESKSAPPPSRPKPMLVTPEPRETSKPSVSQGSAPVSDDAPRVEKGNATEALEALLSAIGECTRCGLSRGRTRLVFGEGNPEARLVFVGEGPGRDEDVAGRPFVGAAGQLLDRIIAAMGLTRGDVYICNVVKCRPPENRNPTESEQKICGPFLRRQLDAIDPEVIVALGSTAAGFLLETDAPVGRLRGRFHPYKNAQVLPTYHPAYLLRTPSAKRAVWEDMQLVMARLGLERKQGGAG